MKRLLSRKTKPVALGRPIHFLPALVGNRPCDLSRDPFKVALRRSFRHLAEGRLPGFDLSLEASIDRIGRGNRDLRGRLDHGDSFSAFGNRDTLTRLDTPENTRGLILEFAYAYLRFSVHVATNVATMISRRQILPTLENEETRTSFRPERR